MKIKNLFTVNNLLVNVKKEECEQLKEFTQKHGIIMKIGNLEEYPSLFPTKISINLIFQSIIFYIFQKKVYNISA